MKLVPGSLRQKIMVGYLAGAVLVAAFALLSWNNLNRQQTILSSSDSVTGLNDNTLEIRRFEKNYFLYRTNGDYSELRNYIGQVNDQLNSDPQLLLFTTQGAIDGLRQNLAVYGDMLEQDFSSAVPGSNVNLENAIREKGKEIVTTTEQIAANRNQVNSAELTSAKRNLLVAIGLLLAAVLAGGIVFSRKALRPLSTLEKHMARIASGEFSLIPTHSRDREFTQLKAAFNKMLLELRERQDYLVKSEKYAALGTLVFGVAHELNNPLANISTSCQILAEEIEEDDIEYKKELLAQIQAETDRARDVVASLLSYSRSREQAIFGLRQAVEDTRRLIKAEIPANVSLEVEVPESLTIYADRQKIQQVLINLIKNAIDAIQGEGHIRVLGSRIDAANAEIVVIDNGAGMDQEQVEKIFDPFFTSKQSGYGLGLFIVHTIISDAGGSISVDSLPGSGTTFRIVLPMKKPEGQADRAAPPEVAPGTPATGADNTGKIMDTQPQINGQHNIAGAGGS